MFSKLMFLAEKLSPEETFFLRSLAPFYFVIGKDHAGATLFLEELYRRDELSYNINFWGGFHALENLFHRNMAAFFYERAAENPISPPWVAQMSLRLKLGVQGRLEKEQVEKALDGMAHPRFLEKLRKTSPHLFED
jgi:hypothetical protein